MLLYLYLYFYTPNWLLVRNVGPFLCGISSGLYIPVLNVVVDDVGLLLLASVFLAFWAGVLENAKIKIYFKFNLKLI